MIKSSFLKKQVEKAKKEKKTPDFLRRLTLLVVDHVLRKHYADTYPMKCLQSSIAISMVLEKFGIKSRAFVGEVCVAQVFEDESISPSWNGFWGDDHHVWTCTEFGEFVDLTIRYLHLHPASKYNSQIPMPALWWENTTSWPCTIKYLHQGIVNPLLPDSEMNDLDVFKKSVLNKLDSALKTHSAQEVIFQPILHGTKSMNELYAKGNLWLQKSIIFQELNIPHPSRIKEREAELMKNYENKA